MVQPGFDAFISYRRSDGGHVARWLRRELEGFRLPRALRKVLDRKLRIYLDTAYERGTSDFYEQSIKPALLASRFLVVVATPDAVKRAGGAEDWIQREVVDFTAGPNGRNVVAVRAAGGFSDPLPADLAQRFPNIEIVDLRGASRLSFLNPVKASRLSSEKLKLIAPLIDLPPDAMPRLRQEEERRQQARLGVASGVSLAVLTAVSGTSIYALQSSFRATRALEDSMFATGRMIITATDASGEIRSNLLNQGCDLLDKLGSGGSSEPGLQEQVICGSERARAHEQMNEHAEARAVLETTVRLASARYEKSQRHDHARHLVMARQSLAEHLMRRKDVAGAEAAFERLRDDARRLLAHHERSGALAEAEAEGLGVLGDIQAQRTSTSDAVESYLAAAAAVARAREWGTDRADLRLITWQARLFRLAAEQQIKMNNGAAALDGVEKSLELIRAIKPERVTNTIALDEAYAIGLAYVIARARADGGAAEKHRSDALAILARVTGTRGVADAVRERAAQIKRWIESRDANAK